MSDTNGQLIDSPQSPRDGEELDLERLEPYLRQHLPQIDGRLEVEQFPSGFSNLTYLLRAGAFEFVLRRPPFGNRVKSAHDMGREHRVLSCLHPVFPPAPKPYLLCEDESILGAPFYLMQRRRGVILRSRLPEGTQLSPVLTGRLCEAFIDQLAALHEVDYATAGLGDLGKPEGYVQRQVAGWTKRYTKAQTDSWQELDQVAAWLHASRPPESGASLVHNDYKYDNVVLAPHDMTRIVAVLDWEMCTLGDPLMDLGTTLAYWTEADDPPEFQAAAFGPTAIAGSLSRNSLAQRYFETTGNQTDHLVFYYAFGLFKLAVIVQQIYYRFFKGHTQDPRFSQLNQMVGLLGRVAAGAIDRDRM